MNDTMKRKKRVHAYIERERERERERDWYLSQRREEIPIFEVVEISRRSDRRFRLHLIAGRCNDGVKAMKEYEDYYSGSYFIGRLGFFFSRENKVEKFSRPALSRKPNAYERKVYLGPFVPVHYGLFDYTNVLSLDATYPKKSNKTKNPEYKKIKNLK